MVIKLAAIIGRRLIKKRIRTDVDPLDKQDTLDKPVLRNYFVKGPEGTTAGYTGEISVMGTPTGHGSYACIPEVIEGQKVEPVESRTPFLDRIFEGVDNLRAQILSRIEDNE